MGRDGGKEARLPRRARGLPPAPAPRPRSGGKAASSALPPPVPFWAHTTCNPPASVSPLANRGPGQRGRDDAGGGCGVGGGAASPTPWWARPGGAGRGWWAAALPQASGIRRKKGPSGASPFTRQHREKSRCGEAPPGSSGPPTARHGGLPWGEGDKPCDGSNGPHSLLWGPGGQPGDMGAQPSAPHTPAP